jgi:hypothetical protein
MSFGQESILGGKNWGENFEKQEVSFYNLRYNNNNICEAPLNIKFARGIDLLISRVILLIN